MDMLFRERNNMHVEKVCTDKIDKDMYALLINVCDKYILYMANKFPEYCPEPVTKKVARPSTATAR